MELSTIGRRTFSPEQIAEALATLRANDGNLLRTSKATGIQRSTLRMWRDGQTPENVPAGDLVPLQSKAEEQIAQRLEGFTLKAMERADTPEFVEGLKGKDLLIASAIAIEKMQLLRGAPTSREGRQITITFAGSGASSLRQLGEDSTKALPEPVIEGEFKTKP